MSEDVILLPDVVSLQISRSSQLQWSPAHEVGDPVNMSAICKDGNRRPTEFTIEEVATTYPPYKYRLKHKDGGAVYSEKGNEWFPENKVKAKRITLR